MGEDRLKDVREWERLCKKDKRERKTSRLLGNTNK